MPQFDICKSKQPRKNKKGDEKSADRIKPDIARGSVGIINL